jgi:uncharacterized membrane protein
MENEEEILDDNLDQGQRPPIYTSRAIRAFAILVTPIFGGVMLMQNLRDIDRKDEGYKVFLFSTLYTIAVYVIASIPAQPGMLTLGLNIIGAMILCDYAYRNYFPDEASYPKKKIWKPLAIAAVMTIIGVWALLTASQTVK